MEAAEDAGICFGFDKKVRETTSDEEMKEVVNDLMKKENTNGNKGLPNHHVNHVESFFSSACYTRTPANPQVLCRTSLELMYEIILK